MGFNTVALFLNDQSDQIAKQPNRVAETLCRAMASGQGAEYGPGQMTVLPSVHADGLQVIVAGGNSIKSLGVIYRLTHDPETILRELAAQHGFRLVRKRRGEHHG